MCGNSEKKNINFCETCCDVYVFTFSFGIEGCLRYIFYTNRKLDNLDSVRYANEEVALHWRSALAQTLSAGRKPVQQTIVFAEISMAS